MQKSSCRSDFMSDNSSSDEENLPQLFSLRERLARKRELQENPSFSTFIDLSSVNSSKLEKVKCTDKIESSNLSGFCTGAIDLENNSEFESDSQSMNICSDNVINSESTECSRSFNKSETQSNWSGQLVSDGCDNANDVLHEQTTKTKIKRSKEEIEDNKRKAQVGNCLIIMLKYILSQNYLLQKKIQNSFFTLMFSRSILNEQQFFFVNRAPLLVSVTNHLLT